LKGCYEDLGGLGVQNEEEREKKEKSKVHRRHTGGLLATYIAQGWRATKMIQIVRT